VKAGYHFLTRRSLAFKINTVLFVLILLIVAGQWVVQSTYISRILTRQALAKGSEIAELFAMLSIAPLRRLDYSTLRGNAEGLLKTEDIISVSLLDSSGFDILPFASKPIPDKAVTTILEKEIYDEIGTKLGTLRIKLSLNQVQIGVAQTRSLLQISFAVILTLSWTAITIMLRLMLLIPIKRLAASMDGVAHGRIIEAVEISSRDEIGVLASSFNTMTMKLKQSLDTQLRSEKLAALGGLVAGVAHEINPPLGVAITAITMMAEDVGTLKTSLADNNLSYQQLVDYTDETNKACDIIQKNLMQAAKLVRSFKQVSADQSSEAKRKINVGTYMEEIIASLKPEFKRTNLTIKLNCPERLNVEMAPGTLSQLITILVLNAKVHAFESDQIGQIHISISNDRSNLTITVSDDGRGMDAETQRRVFDPFFTTKRSSGGTGLGLYILHTIINEQLRGQVEVISHPGAGCLFTLSLPFHPDTIHLVD